MLLDRKTLESINRQLQTSRTNILNDSVTWTDVATKTVNSDGSFNDGSNSTTTIMGSVATVSRSGSRFDRIPQGLAETATHSFMTLKNWGISVGDTITHNGSTFGIVYKFDDQFNTDYQEYLMQIFAE